jgi:hypothetical protein
VGNVTVTKEITASGDAISHYFLNNVQLTQQPVFKITPKMNFTSLNNAKSTHEKPQALFP